MRVVGGAVLERPAPSSPGRRASASEVSSSAPRAIVSRSCAKTCLGSRLRCSARLKALAPKTSFPAWVEVAACRARAPLALHWRGGDVVDASPWHSTILLEGLWAASRPISEAARGLLRAVRRQHLRRSSTRPGIVPVDKQPAERPGRPTVPGRPPRGRRVGPTSCGGGLGADGAAPAAAACGAAAAKGAAEGSRRPVSDDRRAGATARVVAGFCAASIAARLSLAGEASLHRADQFLVSESSGPSRGTGALRVCPQRCLARSGARPRTWSSASPWRRSRITSRGAHLAVHHPPPEESAGARACLVCARKGLHVLRMVTDRRRSSLSRSSSAPQRPWRDELRCVCGYECLPL